MKYGSFCFDLLISINLIFSIILSLYSFQQSFRMKYVYYKVAMARTLLQQNGGENTV